jgi:small subunit ribosomal protein S19
MGRSSYKGPFIDEKLLKKVMAQKAPGGTKTPIKTWARRSQIPPEFVGHTFMVHQGKNFISVYISESMVGHRLGEFAPTRTFRGHGKMTEKSTSKT